MHDSVVAPKPEWILLLAAELIIDGIQYYDCLAIREAGKLADNASVLRPYAALRYMEPSLEEPVEGRVMVGESCYYSNGWFGPVTEESQNQRIIALCFAAAICEEENLDEEKIEG